MLILPFFALGQGIKPGWVTRMPTSDDMRFVGRGEASTNQDNYKALAERNALRSIALEINTEISGTSRRTVTERNDISQKEFTDEFIVSTLANIQGLEKKGEYEDTRKGVYYILWEYPKSVHRKNLDRAKNNAIEIFENFRELQPYQVYDKLDKLVKCLEKLNFVYGDDVYAEFDGRKYNLQNEVPSKINEELRRFELSSTSLYLKGVYMQPVEDPLKITATVRLPAPFYEQPGSNLPIEFLFKYGDGLFMDNVVYPNSVGHGEARIVKISDKIRNQQVTARIDLKAFKSQDLSFAILDRALDKLSSQTELTYNIEVSMQKNDRIAVYVKSSEGIDNRTIVVVNQLFEEAMNRISDFEIVDRTAAEETFKKKGYTSADVCDNENCRIEIGKVLNVDKFVLVDLTYVTSQEELSCAMRYTDVRKQKSEGFKNYNTKAEYGNLLTSLRGIVPEWAADFYAVLNPAKVTFTSNVPRSKVFIDGEMFAFLPLVEQEFEHKDYLFEFRALGYETRTKRIDLGSSIIINEHIDLRPKTPFNAFKKSLLFPGLGQFYSVDEDNLGRKGTGWLMAAGGLLAIAGTAITYNQYIQAFDDYNASKSIYEQQTTMEGIEEYRVRTANLNDTMHSKYTIVLTVSSVAGIYWLGNAIEALINMPQYE